MEYKNYIKGVISGDRNLFRQFMEENIDSIYRLVFRLVAREDEAKDIVQETFIKLWEKHRDLKPDRSLLSWTKRVAINKSYDFLRSVKRRGNYIISDPSVELNHLAANNKTDDKINMEDYLGLINELTAGLSPKQRLIFSLTEIEELSRDEISELTGLSKSSIKSNLHHAKVAIRQKAIKYI